MISASKLFELAFEKANERGWDRIAVAVDLHGTALLPNYSHTLANEFYPHAEECLRLMSQETGVLLYMYTCTPLVLKDMYKTLMNSKGIHIYTSPKEVHDIMNVTTTLYQSFTDKPYFNVTLEDKGGFDPHHDWVELLDYFKKRKKC